jgi:tight adherence protein B
MDMNFWIATVLVFGSVFVLTGALAGNVGSQVQRRLRARLAVVREELDDMAKPASLIREKYLRRLSPLERLLEELPGMRRLGRMVEQAGDTTPAYRVALTCLLLGIAAGTLVSMLTGSAGFALLATAALAPLPVLRIHRRRQERLRQFEEQLPDALDMMARALRAGTPLMESFKFVAEEMMPPISEEFRTTWSHMNYGIGMRASFYDLHQRVPGVSLRAVTTAVLVQRETGGNLAEILAKISDVLRGRFRFQRRLKTLTAEGRISAIGLVAIPFILAGVLSVTSPGYLAIMFNDPMGQRLIIGSLVLMAIGMLWIRRLTRVQV